MKIWKILRPENLGKRYVGDWFPNVFEVRERINGVSFIEEISGVDITEIFYLEAILSMNFKEI